MHDIELRWPGQVDVSPQEVAKVDVRRAAEIIEALNTRITAVEAEIGEKAIYGFKIWRFSYSSPRNKKVAAELSFMSHSILCNEEGLAKAEKLTQMIEETAKIRLAQEAAYSENADKFLKELKPRIEKLGGTIREARPCFEVTLPCKEKLGSESYRLLATQFNYAKLRWHLKELERLFDNL